MNATRRSFLVAAGTVALAGCSQVLPGSDGPNENRSGIAPPIEERRLPLPMAPDALRSEALSGGPSKDGIPSIDNPSFVEAGDVSSLEDGDVVFGLERNGVAKAYPQRILVSHEICNDTVDGEPVAVTYCPLTGTAMGFERGETTFGVSGRLINNNLVMYDRGTEVWWPQVPASSVPGPWNDSAPEASLREFRLIWTTWERWRDRHPDTVVLSADTGFARDYQNDPYGTYNPRGGYYAGGSTNFPRLNSDDRFGTKRVFIGTRTRDGAAAFLKDTLREQGTMAGEIAGEPVLGVYDSGLDTAYVYRNPARANVTLENGEVRLDGSAHDPDALPLDRAYAFDAMWFAWIGFYPDSNVYA